MGACLSSQRHVSSTMHSFGRQLSSRVSSFRMPSMRYLRRRRGSVSAETEKLQGLCSKRREIAPKDDATNAHICGIIKEIPFFRELDDDQRTLLVSAMEARKVTSGETIVSEGEEGDFFYAIDEGKFIASKNGEIKFLYDNKGSFGELALLYNSPRAATIKAESSGMLWALDRKTFRALVVGGMQERRRHNETVLRTMPLFQHLSDEQLAALADCLVPETFDAGTTIISQGDAITSASKFYIVERGEVKCFRATRDGSSESKMLSKHFGPGDVFGEVALLTRSARQADCKAATEVRCLTLARDAFERLMGPCEAILKKNIDDYNRLNNSSSVSRD